ncbi:CHAT domain-containing protein [Portibacter lacus]|nr:CHAT domain-containing protein [Portibacter lacus]
MKLLFISFLVMTYSCTSDKELSKIEAFVLLALERKVDQQEDFIERVKDDPRLKDVLVALSDPLLKLPPENTFHSRIHESKSLIYNKQQSGGIEELKENYQKQNYNDQFDRLTYQEILLTYYQYKVHNSLSPLAFSEEIVPLLSTNWDSEILQFYFDYRILNILSTIKGDENNLNEFLLMNQYLLSKIKNLVNRYDLKYCEEEIRANIANKLFREYDHKFFGEYIYFHLDKISDNENRRFSSNYNEQFIRANFFFEDGDINSANEILRAIDLDSLSITQKSNFYLSSGFFSMGFDNSKAYSFFEKSLQLYQDTFSFAHATRPLLYMMASAPSADKYFEHKSTVDQFIEAGHEASIIAFQKLLFIIDSPYESFNDSQKIELLLEKRSLAEQLWGKEPNFHIQDLYAHNTAEILTIAKGMLSRGQSIDIPTILQLFQETKAIELKRKRAFEQKLELEKNRFDDFADELLLTNEFLSTEYDGHPIYLDIWKNYLHKLIEHSENKLPTNKPIVVPEINLLKNTMVLEFLKFDTSYWSYFVHDQQISISNYSAQFIDSLTIAFQDKMMSKKNVKASIYEFKKYLDLPQDLQNNDGVIIPDGELFNIPFDLIFNNQSISYHYDLAAYGLEKEIVIDNPNLSLFSYSNSETIKSKSKLDYPELTYGWNEVESIHKVLPNSKTYSGSDFRKSTLQSNKSIDIMHISTHASMNKANRLDNFLLCREKDSDPEQVYNFEIESWDSSSPVVILSACETGSGIHRIGAGSYSLSRSFIYAGTDVVLKTLWSVNDKATSEFMVYLYEFWKDGMSLESALQKTKHLFQTHDKYAHPFYWSGFVLEGNGKIKINLD